ncbi:MAG TPA: GGDEF domain-containing protein, partial [Aquabacterium sp.]|nr:GGDEF domain-containing protein [Aquabacterium sp.]
RASDVAGRVGGDEFLVMLTQVGSASAAVLVADKIRAALCQPIVLKEQTVSVGVCIGIALYPQHGLSSQDLAQHADAAMYHAKVNGRNGVVLYQPELAESVSDR